MDGRLLLDRVDQEARRGRGTGRLTGASRTASVITDWGRGITAMKSWGSTHLGLLLHLGERRPVVIAAVALVGWGVSTDALKDG